MDQCIDKRLKNASFAVVWHLNTGIGGFLPARFHIPLDKADALIEQNDQAVDFDPVELYKARQAIRPAQEKAAEQQLEDALHEKLFLLMLFSAKQEGLVYLERIQKNGSCVNFCSSPCDQPICAI